MARKPATNSAETRESIVEAAFKLFGKYGYEGVSVDQIAKATNLTKGALYWHFASKDALYFECLKRLRKFVRRHVFLPMEEEKRPEVRIRLFFEGIIAILQDNNLLDSVTGYILDVGRINPDFYREFKARGNEEYERFMVETLEAGRVQGIFSFNEEAASLARAMSMMIEGSFLQMREEPQESTLKGIRALYYTFCRGIGGAPMQLNIAPVVSQEPTPGDTVSLNQFN